MADEIDDYDSRCPLPPGYDETNARVISSTQLDTDELCRRKWWFRWVAKLPTPRMTALTFGTVTHAVCERWLKADDQGRGPDGLPVELYPAGWNADLDVFESSVVKRLVAEAIEQGILVRTPGREIERDFLRYMVDVDGIACFVRGTVDMLVPFSNPPLIEDHKTTKNMGYAKSPRKLRVLNQPLIYAYDLLQRYVEEDRDFPARIDFTHNVFCKDPKDIRVKKVFALDKKQGLIGATPKEVLDRWELLTQQAKEMLQAARTVKKPFDIPDPAPGACSAYGGCAFQSICSGRDSMEDYTLRMEKIAAREAREDEARKNPPQETQAMTDLKARIAAASGKSTAPAAGAPAINPPTPAPAPRPAAKPAAPPKAAAVEQKWFCYHPGTMEAPLTSAMTRKGVLELLSQLGDDEGLALMLNPAGSPDWKKPAEEGFLPPFVVEAVTPDAPIPLPTAKAPAQTKTPWHFPGCTACAKNPILGFNENGKICRMCEAKFGKPVVSVWDVAYDMSVPGVSTPKWREKKVDAAGVPVEGLDATTIEADGSEEDEQTPAPAAPEAPTEDPFVTGNPTGGVTAEAMVTSIAKRGPGRPRKVVAPPAPVVEATPVPAALAPDEAAVVKAAEAASRGRGRPPKGFTLMIGVSCSKGFPASVQLDDFLERYGAALAEHSKTESYYDLNAFDRRDKLARLAKKMAEEFGTATVFANGTGVEIRHMIDAIRPFASTVYEASSR